MIVTLRYDLRSAPFGAPHPELYAAALDHCEWLDGTDLPQVGVVVNEHHGADDGYLPSPIVLAAAIAGRTRRATISLSALVAPFYHPIRLAEDLAVLDLVSDGRASIVIAGGYRADEFAMYGVDGAQRGDIVEEVVTTLKKAWTGEPFEFRGSAVRVTPRPRRQPGPPIILGGSSPAAARRAARIADGFLPSSPALTEVYRAERERLGLDPGPPGQTRPIGGSVALVTEDPDEGWATVGPYCLHEMNSYAAWIADSPGASGPFFAVPDVETLRQSGRYLVLTPQECVDVARTAGRLTLCPLVGGLPPAEASASLELFATKVLPALQAG